MRSSSLSKRSHVPLWDTAKYDACSITETCVAHVRKMFARAGFLVRIAEHPEHSLQRLHEIELKIQKLAPTPEPL